MPTPSGSSPDAPSEWHRRLKPIAPAKPDRRSQKIRRAEKAPDRWRANAGCSARSTGRAGMSCWLAYCAAWDASQDTFGRAGRTLVLRCFSIRSNLRMSASLFCRNMISCAREVAARLVEPAGRIMHGLRDTGFAYRHRVCRSDGVSGSKRAQDLAIG